MIKRAPAKARKTPPAKKAAPAPKPTPGPVSAAPPPRAVPPSPTRAQPIARPARAINLTPKAAPNPPAVALPSVQVQAPKKTKILPWITLGGSLIAAGVGAGFAARTASLLGDDSMMFNAGTISGRNVELTEEYADYQKQVFTSLMVSTILLSAATGGTIASLIALWTD